MSPIKVDIWSYIQNPWCYIGKRKFEAAVADFAGEVAVEYHSFELAPDTPVDFAGTPLDYLSERKGISRAQAKTMIDRVVAIASSAGLDYDYDAIHQTNTVLLGGDPHLAAVRGDLLERAGRLAEAQREYRRGFGAHSQRGGADALSGPLRGASTGGRGARPRDCWRVTETRG